MRLIVPSSRNKRRGEPGEFSDNEGHKTGTGQKETDEKGKTLPRRVLRGTD